MNPRYLPLALAATLLSATAQADDTSVAGPTMGYLVDRAQAALRPILGLPGSALLGPAAKLPFAAARVVASPGGRHLLAQERDTRQWQLVADSGKPDQSQPLPDLLTDADLVVFSTDGSAAALYSASRQQVQVLRGLPSSPAVARTIELGSVPGLLAAVAVSADGERVLMALSTDAGTLLLRSAGAAPPQQIATADRVTSLAFTPGDSDAVLADAGRKQIVLLRDVANAAEARVLAAEADGVADPVAVAADAQGYVAAGSAGQVWWIGRSDGTVKQFDCGCAPSGLTALAKASLWRLNDGGDGPLWVLDAAAGRLFFVPAGGIE